MLANLVRKLWKGMAGSSDTVIIKRLLTVEECSSSKKCLHAITIDPHGRIFGECGTEAPSTDG